MKKNSNFDFKFSCCEFCENSKNKDNKKICFDCNGDNNFQNSRLYLGLQTIIKNKYIIDKILFFNMESVTYLAFDKNSNQKYFVKEYFPLEISTRVPDSSYILPLQKKEAQYKALMIDFIDLHKTLFNLSSQGIIPIKEICSENNTVYIIKKYIELTSLGEFLGRQTNNYLSWYRCKPFFLKLNSILAYIHKHGLIHRGICPENIFFDKSNNIYIDGFCISCVRTDNSELKAELYKGFSAPEQYQTNGWQGTWTDVYSVAATLYNVLTGQTILDKINNTNKPVMPHEIETAIYKATKTNHRERTQNINKFNSDLIDESFSDKTAIFNLKDTEQKNISKNISGSKNKMKKLRNIIIIFVLILLIIFILVAINIINILKGRSKTEKIAEKYIEQNAWLFDDDKSDDTSQSNIDDINILLGQSDQKKISNQKITTLPNFVGEQISDIKNNKIYSSKLNFIIEEEFSESTKGEIIFQDPLPGISLKNIKDSKLDVILKISKGPEYVKVPDLLNKPISEAIDILEKLEIKYEIVEVYNKNYKDNVINDMNKKADEDIIKNKEILILRVKSSEISSSSSSSSSSTEIFSNSSSNFSNNFYDSQNTQNTRNSVESSSFDRPATESPLEPKLSNTQAEEQPEYITEQ